MRTLRRLVALLRRRRIDADLSEEIATHLELRRRTLVESGMTPEAAAHEARRQFGNVTAIRERTRDELGGVALASLLQDLRYGVRQLRVAPGLSAAVILTIALGAGINSALFLFANEALPGRVALPDSGALVWLDDGKPRNGLTYPDYVTYRERARSLEGIAAFSTTGVAARLPREEQARQARAVLASGNYFTVLRTAAVLGRTLADADDRPGVTPVAVVSDAYWARRFNRDPSILGRAVDLNFTPFTIVGVLPPGFSGPRAADGNPYAPDIWVPMSSLPVLMPGDTRLTDRTAWWGLQVLGRRHDDVSLEQVRAELRVVAAALDAEFPGARPPRTPWAWRADEFDRRVLKGEPAIVAGVLGTVSLSVLVVACANVAGLLLARVSTRRREIAVRLSLGAGRFRIMRQFLAEGLILSAAGTLGGLLAARWTLLAVLSTNTEQTIAWSFQPDLRVVSFALFLTLVATLCTGWMPALQASKTSLVSDLTRTSSPSVSRLRGILLGIEVAVCLVLMLGTALLLRGVTRAQTLDPGLPVDRLLALDVDAALHGYTGKAREDVLQQVRREAAALPGVTATSLVHPVPFSGSRVGSTIRTAEAPDGLGIHVSIGETSPEFFAASDVPIVRGRAFTPGTDEIVVNERLARELWPGKDPLGARVTTGEFSRFSYVVVGVARDTPYLALRQSDVPFLFRSGSAGTILIRTDGPAAALTRPAIAAATRVDGRFVATARSLADGVAEELTVAQAMTGTAAALGALTFLLALGGIAATAAQHVAHRTREIGIRMALGATRRGTVSLVVRRALVPVMIGAGAGLLIASQASAVLTVQLYGVSPTDPLAFAASGVLVTAGAAIAAWLPARRAASIDPLVALRAE